MRQPPFDPPSSALLLVVDDDEDIRDALGLYLEMQGYRVVCAASAEQGLARACELAPDLILTDYAMRGGSGVWMLEELRARAQWPPAGAFVISAHDHVKAPEGVPVLRKPVDLEDLVRSIHLRLCEGRPSSPHLRIVRMADRPEPRIELALYVCEGSIGSERAIRNVRRILGRYDEEEIAFEILDVAEAPDEAERDRIDFTPALVKRRPAPRAWLLGDFSDPAPLSVLLDAHGLEPRDSTR